MPRILVIDDDPDTVQLLAHMVALGGYAVDQAQTAAQALELVRTHPPDAIVLDVMMYDTDGWTLFHQLRALTDAPVTFLTAWRTGENAERARNLNAAFLAKPISLQTLMKQITSMLDGEST